MNALVTGGAGFIGSHLVRALLDKGARVRVIDNFSTGKRQNLDEVRDRVELIEDDIRSRDACARAVKDCDVIFHQAALASVARSVENPADSNDVNVGGTVNVLDAARRAGVGRLVYAASSSAYGETPVLPKIETMTPTPLSPYAVSKLAGEHYLAVFAKLYGMKTCALRYFNVFGPRQDPKSEYAAVIPRFVTSMLAGEAPTIFGDGEQTRDFCFIANVVQANLKAAQSDVSGQAVNIACGARISLNDLVGAINKLIGTDIKPRYAAPRAGDVKHSLADIGAARALIGYEPTHDFHAGLKIAVESYRK